MVKACIRIRLWGYLSGIKLLREVTGYFLAEPDVPGAAPWRPGALKLFACEPPGQTVCPSVPLMRGSALWLATPHVFN